MRVSSELSSEERLLKPLAASLAATFVLAPLSACANSVSNCNDSGAGSLRAAVLATASGGTVDMTTLDCVITLTSGQIDVTQNKLTISGPGRDHLTISAGGTSRVLRHLPTVTSPSPELDISGVTISTGHVYYSTGPSKGGCILGNQILSLTDTTLTDCYAGTYSGAASGGAAFAYTLKMANSTVSGSSVSCNPFGSATGGGLFAESFLQASYSTIANNHASCPSCTPGLKAKGGGAYTNASASFTATTIAGNSTTGDGGGVYGLGNRPVTVVSSTVSGNSAGRFAGGIKIAVGADLTLSYSTVTSNSAAQGSTSVGNYQAPGVHIITPIGFDIVNSILVDNTYGVAHAENDFSVTSPGAAVVHTISSNLIGVSTATIPNGNLTGVCPLLGPLRDNGGPTQTHALLTGSPALDAGNAAAGHPLFDQRGSPYGRISTAGMALMDIGAYELQDEIVFVAGFDRCQALP